MAVIVDPKGVGMPEKDAKAMVSDLADKTPYIRKEVMVCLVCKKIIDITDETLLSNFMCEKCWREMVKNISVSTSFKGFK